MRQLSVSITIMIASLDFISHPFIEWKDTKIKILGQGGLKTLTSQRKIDKFEFISLFASGWLLGISVAVIVLGLVLVMYLYFNIWLN